MVVPRPSAGWAFPCIGVFVGGAGGLAFAGLRSAGAPGSIAALWALVATMLLTGALHEDGLADTADGFGGGVGRERKLAIMRDSRIGSFGAIALILSVAIRASALAAIDDTAATAWRAAAALVAAGTLGRAAMLLPLATLPPARDDGLAASVAAPPQGAVGLGFALSIIAAFLLLDAARAIAALIAVAVVAFAGAGLARRQIGGHTGDVLGAIEQVAECAVLSVLACGR